MYSGSCMAARPLRCHRGSRQLTRMLTESQATGLLAVFVALLPAILRLWWGGALARAVHEPALPERLAANRRRNVQSTASCCALLISGLPFWAFWTLPLLMVARLL